MLFGSRLFPNDGFGLVGVRVRMEYSPLLTKICHMILDGCEMSFRPLLEWLLTPSKHKCCQWQNLINPRPARGYGLGAERSLIHLDIDTGMYKVIFLVGKQVGF